jgi:hypothetical protein
VTGKPPYSDLIAMSAMFRIVEDDVPPLPENISEVKEIPFLLKKKKKGDIQFSQCYNTDRIINILDINVYRT